MIYLKLLSSNRNVAIIRKNISNYLPNELLDFRNAMEKFMLIRDNRGYNHIAGFHGAPDFYCWHHQRNDRYGVSNTRPISRMIFLLTKFYPSTLNYQNPTFPIFLPFSSWMNSMPSWWSMYSHQAGIGSVAPRLVSASCIS